MRARIGAITRSTAPRREHEPRLPRRFRPRTARATFVPLQDASVVRGLRAA